MSNESHDLAEAFIVEQIDKEMKDAETHTGVTVPVDGLQDCDCIPLSVVDLQGRTWWLKTAECRGRYVSAFFEIH